MDVLECFKKSILANGGNIFKVNCFHSFSQPHTAEKNSSEHCRRGELFLTELMRGAAVFHGESEFENILPHECFPLMSRTR